LSCWPFRTPPHNLIGSSAVSRRSIGWKRFCACTYVDIVRHCSPKCHFCDMCTMRWSAIRLGQPLRLILTYPPAFHSYNSSDHHSRAEALTTNPDFRTRTFTSGKETNLVPTRRYHRIVPYPIWPPWTPDWSSAPFRLSSQYSVWASPPFNLFFSSGPDLALW
jgi:hypothetical protein